MEIEDNDDDNYDHGKIVIKKAKHMGTLMKDNGYEARQISFLYVPAIIFCLDQVHKPQ